MITIGLIDDDAMVRTGLRLILGGDADLEVIGEADDGDTGLELITRHRPDVILLDIRMPRMDGLAVLDRLSARTARPQVLVLTTFDTDDNVLRALWSGAAGFLLKDAEPPEMIRAIKAVHNGEPALSPQVMSRVIAAATGPAARDPRLDETVATLSDREREVAVAVAGGLTNTEISRRLFISVATVKATLSRIFTKLGVDNRVSAAMMIRDAGLLD
jgi:DNA-binding NarL/FixJ family response regulator